MSKKSGLKILSISTIVIISIAFYYTFKDQSIKRYNNKYFEVSNLTTTFGKKDFRSALLFDPEGRGVHTSYNVPYIHIKAQITNLTGEDIEVAKIFPELLAEFKYGNKVFTLMDFNAMYGVWKSNQTLNIEHDFILNAKNDEGERDDQFMNHHPEKLELKLSVHGSNSVGMNLKELIFIGEINSWNVN